MNNTNFDLELNIVNFDVKLRVNFVIKLNNANFDIKFNNVNFVIKLNNTIFDVKLNNANLTWNLIMPILKNTMSKMHQNAVSNISMSQIFKIFQFWVIKKSKKTYVDFNVYEMWQFWNILTHYVKMTCRYPKSDNIDKLSKYILHRYANFEIFMWNIRHALRPYGISLVGVFWFRNNIKYTILNPCRWAEYD